MASSPSPAAVPVDKRHTPPTDRQLQLLIFIESHVAEHGYPPTIREMGNGLGIRSTNAVNDLLVGLARRGLITRAAAVGHTGPSRTVRSTRSAQVRRCPHCGGAL
jgi:repressor LexA